MTGVKYELTPRQWQFSASLADITVYGGAAGGGKTFALLTEPLKYTGKNVHDYRSLIFRREWTEITAEGALWDEASEFYPGFGGMPSAGRRRFVFPNGATAGFAHMQLEKTKNKYRGAQVTTIMFDQLETFTESQFTYMFSRNRSRSNVVPRIKATANPEPGWLYKFLSWWIAEDGYADLSRSGKIRYLLRYDEENHWADTPGELEERFSNYEDVASKIKSVTFILSTPYDNPYLPDNYIASLSSMHRVDRERLLGDKERGGNWKVVEEPGTVFRREWFEFVPVAPMCDKYIRGWDFAATEQKDRNNPDHTSSCLIGYKNGIYYIVNVTDQALHYNDTDKALKNISAIDRMVIGPAREYLIRIEQEGGGSGKKVAGQQVALMAGYDIKGVQSVTNKIIRAKPLARQMEAGNVRIVMDTQTDRWNEKFMNQLLAQPNPKVHDDMMDAASLAFNSFGETREAGGW